jgi:YspA, cpYpsA-related SLOG family
MADYRVLITGSRQWPEPQAVYLELGEVLSWAWTSRYDSLTVVHGACPSGADKYASDWCKFPHALASITVIEERHPADWKNHGKAAGFMRNKEMADLGADECLAFIYDESPGATQCAQYAETSKGIPTRRIVP